MSSEPMPEIQGLIHASLPERFQLAPLLLSHGNLGELPPPSPDRLHEIGRVGPPSERDCVADGSVHCSQHQTMSAVQSRTVT